jgi:hypothetical protein
MRQLYCCVTYWAAVSASHGSILYPAVAAPSTVTVARLRREIYRMSPDLGGASAQSNAFPSPLTSLQETQPQSRVQTPQEHRGQEARSLRLRPPRASLSSTVRQTRICPGQPRGAPRCCA